MYKTIEKTSRAMAAAVKAIVEKYQLPTEAYKIATEAFNAEMLKKDEDHVE